MMQQFLNRSFQGLHQYLQFPYGATKFDFASVSKNVLYGVGNLTVRYVRLQFQMAKCAHGCATRSNKSYLIDEGPLFCQMAAPSLESSLLQNWGAITTPILVEAKPHPRCVCASAVMCRVIGGGHVTNRDLAELWKKFQWETKSVPRADSKTVVNSVPKRVWRDIYVEPT